MNVPITEQQVSVILSTVFICYVLIYIFKVNICYMREMGIGRQGGMGGKDGGGDEVSEGGR